MTTGQRRESETRVRDNTQSETTVRNDRGGNRRKEKRRSRDITKYTRYHTVERGLVLECGAHVSGLGPVPPPHRSVRAPRTVRPGIIHAFGDLMTMKYTCKLGKNDQMTWMIPGLTGQSPSPLESLSFKHLTTVSLNAWPLSVAAQVEIESKV